MRLEENVAVGVGIAVAALFLIWFLLTAFVSSSIGGGMIPGSSSVSPGSAPGAPPPGTTTVVKLPNGKTATVTVPAVTTTGP
jgi:hypothetical protein